MTNAPDSTSAAAKEGAALQGGQPRVRVAGKGSDSVTPGETDPIEAITLADASVLAGFKLTQILQQDAKTRSAILLGTFVVPAGPDGSPAREEQAIILLEKTHFDQAFYSSIGDVADGAHVDDVSAIHSSSHHSTHSTTPQRNFDTRCDDAERSRDLELRHFSHLVHLGHNDIYYWLLGYLRPASPGQGPADVKFSMIRPATATHIAKYTEQEKILIHETPQVYKDVTLPWIEAQDPSRIAWVGNILEGKKEKENVIYTDDDPATGFVILPDLKWDRRTLPSLYLIAIARDPTVRTLRDLRKEHVPLLRKIAAAAEAVVASQYGLIPPHIADDGNTSMATATAAKTSPLAGKLRCFIHYPPSYYHLHVHILSADYTSHPGAIVGQAHLLDDVIDLLEMGVDFTQRTLGYHVGVRSDIYSKVFGPLLASEAGKEH
ncbi:unnamed protein product [Parajaminaea phylloscopi]